MVVALRRDGSGSFSKGKPRGEPRRIIYVLNACSEDDDLVVGTQLLDEFFRIGAYVKLVGLLVLGRVRGMG